MLEELFFTTETLALVLVLGGLAAARRWSSAAALVVAGALAGSAGNVKEVFLLAPLALIPLALRHPRGQWRGLAWTGAGVVAAYAATVAVLVLWGPAVLTGYLEVLSFKRQRFPAPGVDTVFSQSADYALSIVTWLPLLGVLVVGVVLTLILSRGAVRSASERHAWTGTHASLVILLGAVLVGFVWQGGPMEVHYALAVIIPLYLALGAVVGWGLSRSRGLGTGARTTVAVLLLVGLVPTPAAVLWGVGSVRAIDAGALAEAVRNLETPEDRATFTEVAALTDPNDCIQVAYGWSASAVYWYSDRDPCARFIVPPLALSPDLSAEYRQALVDSPPSVIVLDPALVSETTVPAEQGTPDDVIFPFAAVVAACYEPVPGDPLLFQPRGLMDATSQCIADQVSLEIR
jgi:hypothetical protein